ncbi:MAG TPA: MFS transporter [Opitutaceae bacterium]|jgi:GPH family glycoside/pentoside/hexuronide:cation symporter
MASDNEKLSAREKLSYGFGDLASCLYWQTISQYLAIFYTDYFGISALAAGAMMSLSRSADAFVDPLVGMLSDRTRSRWGKYRPYLLFGCIPLAIAGVLTFTVPSFSEHGKLIWAAITFNVMMILYTTINIPYTALLGVMTSNSTVRTTLSSIKYVGAYTAGVIVSATLLPMVKVGGWLGVSSPTKGFQYAFIIYGAAAVVFFLVVFFNTRERVQSPKVHGQTMLGSIGRDLGDLVTNGPWIMLLVSTISFILFVSLRGSATAHYFKYYVGPHTITLPDVFFLPRSVRGQHVWTWEYLVSFFNTTNQALSILGAMLVPFVARWLGNKTTFITLFTIAILSTASFYFLRPDQLVLIYLINAAGSITGGPLSALIMAMYADTADYAEWKKGRRTTGLIFSASIFAQKQGWGLGSGLSLILMSQVGFVPNVAQTAESLHGLVLLMSILPAALGMVCFILILFYPLNERRMAEIGEELKKRRAADGTDSTVLA